MRLLVSLRIAAVAAVATVAAVAGFGACDTPRGGGGSRRPGRGAQGDPLKGITLVPLKVALSGPGATAYGGESKHRLTPIETAVLQALRGHPVQHDPALSKMARELARASPDRTNIPTGLVDGIMSWAGLVDPPPRIVVVELPVDNAGCHLRPSAQCQGAIESLVDEVVATLPDAGPITVGAGVVRLPGNGTRMIVAVSEKAVALEPVPTSIGPGRSIAVKGRLLGDRSKPYLEVFDPTGTSVPVRATVSADGRFGATVPCRAPRGVYQVEVLAEGPHGPEVAANFPIYCGRRSPTTLEVELERLDPSVAAEQVARANLLYLNAERKRRGFAELAWDERAADVALGHSKDMARNGFVGHRSPRTGDVSQRFARAKISGSVVRENVARGYGPKGIHRSLMTSPGHRVNIVASDVTHVGIGVVIGSAETSVADAPRPVFLTQNFFRKPGAGAPPDKQMAPQVRKVVNGARRQAKLPAVAWDPGLNDIATQVARAVARGKRAPAGWEKDVFELGYQSVETHQVRSGDFGDLGGVPLWSTPDLAAGFGIAQMADGFLMIVLVGVR